MTVNNIRDYEYPEDMSCTIGRTSRLQICSEPNDIEGMFYFKVFDSKDSSKFCRISMTAPEFIGADDESLIITHDDINEIINLFNEDCVTFKDHIPLGYSNWGCLIRSNNNESIGSKDECPNIYVDDDLPMPDYTKLLS